MVHKLINYFVSIFSKNSDLTNRIKINIILALLLRGASVLISLVLIPVTINYVNSTQYGIWLTLSSLITWFYFFDIGLGNGLKNKLAESNALEKYRQSKVFVSTTYAVLIIISTIIFLGFLIVSYFINWNSVLNIYSLSGTELKNIALILITFFCIQFVLQLLNIVLTASHSSAMVSLLAFIGQVCCLISILILKSFTAGSLLNLVLVLGGVPLVVILIGSLILYRFKLRKFSPSVYYVNFKYSKSLLTMGGVFFIIQMGQLVLYQTDNIVITQLFGPKDVTTFNIGYKYFSIITILFTIMINPFWSAFTDAYAKNDFVWIKGGFIKMQKYWLLGVAATIVLLILSPFVLRLWVGNEVTVPLMLLITIGVSAIASTWHMLCCFLLNGINKIRLQLYLYIIGMIINIPVEIYLGKMFGIAGAILSNVIVFALMGIVLYMQCIKIINRSANGIWNS